jgi:Domain of unknown function (DUF4873)
MSAEILPEDGYAGHAELLIGTQRLDVQVELRGFFQPIDGRYHWYGRIAADDRIAALVTGGRAEAVLDVGHGPAPCELAEPDLWGRYRVTGQSTPPFPVAATAG